MKLFRSKRERRLWIWTLAVVVAIYSTLGMTRALASFLRDNGLLELAFILGMILVGATILIQGLKWQPRGMEIAVALGAASVYLLVFVRMGIPEERTHLIEYGVLAILIFEALSERKRNGTTVPMPAVLALLMTVLLGWIDEGIQAILPNRVFDIRDVGFNSLAALMAIGASLALSWARQRGR